MRKNSAVLETWAMALIPKLPSGGRRRNRWARHRGASWEAQAGESRAQVQAWKLNDLPRPCVKRLFKKF